MSRGARSAQQAQPGPHSLGAVGHALASGEQFLKLWTLYQSSKWCILIAIFIEEKSFGNHPATMLEGPGAASNPKVV